MAPQFVDVSSFQGAIDWVAYRSWAAQWDGIARVAIKATEGVGFTDPQFAANRAGALAAGIDTILYYHYARPQYNGPASEADYMHSVVGDIRPQDLIVLDLEENAGQGVAPWAYDWLARQDTNYDGKMPAIYSYAAYIEEWLQQSNALAKYPLWLAEWTFDPNERPICPTPWSKYIALQYTDKATNVPGITGNVDCSVFIGGKSVNQYGPASSDFATWFDLDANGNWVGKSYNHPVIAGGNKTLYARLSIDGNTLPVIGLPRTSELYQTDSDGYQWSVQFFERGLIVYDPQFKKDSEPGLGVSYIGKPLQFLDLDPDYQPQTIEVVPDILKADLQTVLPATVQAMDSAWKTVLTKLMQDAGLPTQ